MTLNRRRRLYSVDLARLVLALAGWYDSAVTGPSLLFSRTPRILRLDSMTR